MPRPWLLVVALLAGCLVVLTVRLFWRFPAVAAQAPPNTGTISGRVVDDETGDGIAEARVVLSDERSGPAREVGTDASGHFSIAGIADGTYVVAATKAGYVGLATLRSAAPRRIASNHTHDVTVRLARSAVLAGRVLDPAGRPMAFARAQLLRADRVDSGFFYVDSNRAGEFRLEGVRAGPYVLRGIPMNEPLTGPTRLMPTYYPSADDRADATVIDVGSGETQSGLDVTIREVSTALISGRLLDASGRPYDIGADVEPMARRGGSVEPIALLAGAESGRVGSDGRFRLRLPVGPYRLTASPAGIGSVSAGPGVFIDELWARLAAMAREYRDRGARGTADIDLDEGGTSELTIRMQSLAFAKGRVVFEGEASPPPPHYVSLDVLSLGLEPTERLGIDGPSTDWTIAVPIVPGPWAVDVVAPVPWTLKAVLCDGIEMAQHPVMSNGEAPKEVLVVMTDRPTSIRFSVSDPAGAATTDYVALVFPVDDRLWGKTHDGRARWHMPAGSRDEGDALDVPPGRYYAVAVDDLESEAVHDPGVLRMLSQHAVAVTVDAGNHPTISLQRVPLYATLRRAAALGRRPR